MYAVIAISRLQFIRKRWHTGVRNTYHHHHRRSPQMLNLPRQPPTTFSTTLFRPINENVVPVVLNENLPSVAASNRTLNSAFGRPSTPSNEDTLPWSGSTPPSRDMGLRSPNRNGLVIFVGWGSIEKLDSFCFKILPELYSFYFIQNFYYFNQIIFRE